MQEGDELAARAVERFVVDQFHTRVGGLLELAMEQIGIARTWAAVERADLALLLVDARATTDALAPEDAALLARLPAALPRLVVHNKADLAGIAPLAVTRDEGGVPRRHVWLSARTGEGMALLEAEVRAITGTAVVGEDVFLARERHVIALRSAQAHLGAAAAHLRTVPPPVEFFAEELYEAQQELAAITGEFTADDLLGEIFSRFCIGK
jgi:tRNA modification GTPase